MTDPVLALLIDLVEAAPSDSPLSKRQITLSVGGMLVTGYLALPKEFFDSDPVLELVWKELDRAEEKQQPQAEKPRRQFIHLRKVRFFSAGKPVPTSGTVDFWRGRLSEIDGFHFGMLAIEGEPIAR
jgi:hypothetical protein